LIIFKEDKIINIDLKYDEKYFNMIYNLNQGITIWLTGLSGSGKTTLAYSLQKALLNEGIKSVVLDGDEIRQAINSDLNYSNNDREENNRRVAEIARILNKDGITCISALISPTNVIRRNVKKIIGGKRFILVYLDTPLHICEKRDKKLLYQNARAGNINEFTGISSIYEEPKKPDIKVDGLKSIDENIAFILSKLDLRS
jgi:adenylylsulfate kinase